MSEEGKVHVFLPPEDGRKEIEESDFQIVKTDTGKIGTTVTLSGVLPQKKEVFTVENVDNRIGAGGLKQYVLCNLLQRFVSLKNVQKDFKVTFHSDLVGQKSDAVLQTTDIPDHSWSGHIEVSHVGGDAKITADLAVTHYKLDANLYNLPGNIVGLCANSAIAQNITNRYLSSTLYSMRGSEARIAFVRISEVDFSHTLGRAGSVKKRFTVDHGNCIVECKLGFLIPRCSFRGDSHGLIC